MKDMRQAWLEQLGQPRNYEFEPSFKLLKKYDHPEFDGELYLQANGPGTFQRVFMVFPKNLRGRVPAVAVPFYFPEAMLGFELDSGEPLPSYDGLAMLRHLAQRGYAAASADAYHLTYLKSERQRGDFYRWLDAGTALVKDHPGWTGIGKLVADTRLLMDALAGDPRVDASRIGITGHSLGGKMAFYTGCLDPRVKAIMTSDFGFGWDQTNWSDIWYWGGKVEQLKALAMEHSSLLGSAAPKPFCLLAGQYDTEESWQRMLRAPGYRPDDGRLVIYNHASGHRPPDDVLNKGYDFLVKWLT